MTVRAGFIVKHCASILWASMLSTWAAHAAPPATTDVYARAARFLSLNQDRYITNSCVQPHWMGAEDRFWYERAKVTGGTEVVIIDAASGARIAVNQRIIGPSETPEPGTSPNGKWVALLNDHDIWIRANSNGQKVALTEDGRADWGYAGSPGGSGHAISDRRRLNVRVPQVLWSPDSRFLLTHRIDERHVRNSWLVQSVPESESAPPRLHTYRYSMPGDEHLPQLELLVFDVETRQRAPLAIPRLVLGTRTLIEKREVWWSADSKMFFYLERDRFSKWVKLSKVNVLNNRVETLLQETSDTFVQTNANSIFGPPLARTLINGDIIWYSQRDGWGHLYHFSSTGALRRRITGGDWAVRDIVRVDEGSKQIYFTGSGRESGRDPYQQYLYSIRFDGSGLKLLTPEDADHSWPHQPSGASSKDGQLRFSPSGKYFLDCYSRPDLPAVLVLRASNGRLLARLEATDISKLREGGHRPIEPFEVRAADGKTPIYGNLFRPSTFEPRRKYPVIDSVYTVPTAIRTAKRFASATFDPFEAQSLAELGFIVVTIDGRGTPHRSKAFLDHAYGRLERANDLEDHIAGIKELARRYPYMDLNRVGVDGVSGGGYGSARAVLAHPDFYRVAVAAEGNHEPAIYAATWGETFLGTPDLAKDRYAAASNIPLAGNLRGRLFLMHGEMDDNVHPVMTMRLVDALIRADKEFDLLLIPNGDHLVWQTPYFIRRKWDFFVRHLLEDVSAEEPVGPIH